MITPDMPKVWGKVLKSLRENKEDVLHAACMDLSDLEFTNDNIIITCKDQSLFLLLNKYQALLNTYAGKDVIRLYRPKQRVCDTKKIEALQNLFGNRITILKE